MFANIKALGFNSTIYIAGNLLVRGISFLLIPVYTSVLTPEDYGILAVTTTVGALLTVVLGLALEGAITQLYFQYESEDERRSLYGSLLAFWLIVPGLVTLALDALGQVGWFDFSPNIPFQPYLRLALWTSYLSIFVNMPMVIYMTRQQPIRAISLSIFQSLITIGITLYLVVILKRKVIGSLQAALLASMLVAIVSIFLTVRMSSRSLSWSKLRCALGFSVPLVPHLGANWALNLSDRFILERNVSTSQLGLYSLGYQFGFLISIFSGALNNAFFPLVNAQLSNETTRHRVPILGTYALLGIVFVGLGVGLFGGDAIRLLTPDEFHGAASVIPWLAIAYVFQGIYYIWSRGTWVSMRTRWVPVLTMLVAGLNVGLNLWLVPRWGIVAAAFDTAVAFGIMALLHGYLAYRLYPIAWEYGRWTKMLIAGIAWFVVGDCFTGSSFSSIAFKAVILFVLFPLSLAAARFFKREEADIIQAGAIRLRSYVTIALTGKG